MQKCAPQLDWPVHLGAVPQLGRGIDRSPAVAALLGSPRCIRIKIFERETDVVHQFVTTGTWFIFPVKRHLLAQRKNLRRSGRRVVQRRNIWRWLRGGRAEN